MVQINRYALIGLLMKLTNTQVDHFFKELKYLEQVEIVNKYAQFGDGMHENHIRLFYQTNTGVK